MDELAVVGKIKIAIDILFSNDKWLFEQNLNERSITHKFAEYLQLQFLDYNVDCEYNGNSLRVDGRKRIYMLNTQIELSDYFIERDMGYWYNQFTEKSVYPDIIIHKRGTNDRNLCIIEVKKSTSKISSDYDKIKLNAYTTDQYGNDLKYSIGLFIEFETGSPDLNYKIMYFKNGSETNEFTRFTDTKRRDI